MAAAVRVLAALAFAGIALAVVGAIHSVIGGTWSLLLWQLIAALWPVSVLIFVHRMHQNTKEN